VAGGWRRLHNEELHNLDASANIIKVMKARGEGEMGGVCGTRGRDDKCVRDFGGKT
jgi:hypothetical protein